MLQRRLINISVKIANMHPEEFFPGVAEAGASLAVDAANKSVEVDDKECLRRVVHEYAEASLDRSQLVERVERPMRIAALDESRHKADFAGIFDAAIEHFDRE